MMDLNKIYKILNAIKDLDDDYRQDIAIKIWQSYEYFDADKGKLSTWVHKVAYNYVLDQKKKISTYNNSIPLSFFERETEGGWQYNNVSDLIHSDGLSPEEQYIEGEEKEELLERIKKLPDKYSKILKEYMADKYNPAIANDRLLLSRAKQMLRDVKK